VDGELDGPGARGATLGLREYSSDLPPVQGQSEPLRLVGPSGSTSRGAERVDLGPLVAGLRQWEAALRLPGIPTRAGVPAGEAAAVS